MEEPKRYFLDMSCLTQFPKISHPDDCTVFHGCPSRGWVDGFLQKAKNKDAMKKQLNKWHEQAHLTVEDNRKRFRTAGRLQPLEDDRQRVGLFLSDRKFFEQICADHTQNRQDHTTVHHWESTYKQEPYIETDKGIVFGCICCVNLLLQEKRLFWKAAEHSLSNLDPKDWERLKPSREGTDAVGRGSSSNSATTFTMEKSVSSLSGSGSIVSALTQRMQADLDSALSTIDGLRSDQRTHEADQNRRVERAVVAGAAPMNKQLRQLRNEVASQEKETDRMTEQAKQAVVKQGKAARRLENTKTLVDTKQEENLQLELRNGKLDRESHSLQQAVIDAKLRLWQTSEEISHILHQYERTETHIEEVIDYTLRMEAALDMAMEPAEQVYPLSWMDLQRQLIEQQSGRLRSRLDELWSLLHVETILHDVQQILTDDRWSEADPATSNRRRSY